MREKCPNTEFFLVHIFLHSVWIQENTDRKKLRIWTLFTQWLTSQPRIYIKRLVWKTYVSCIPLCLFRTLHAAQMVNCSFKDLFGKCEQEVMKSLRENFIFCTMRCLENIRRFTAKFSSAYYLQAKENT